MIYMSLNLRGVGGTLKAASFRRALENTHPNLIFIQETLVHEHKAQAFMIKFHPTWVSCAVSSVGSWEELLYHGTLFFLICVYF
jgi:hypothetical protein